MSLGLVLSDLFERHETRPDDPERPERIAAVADALLGAGLAESATQIEPTQASREQILRCHAPDLVEAHEAMHRRGGGTVEPDTFMGEHSWPTALLAAGSAVAAAEAVARGEVHRAFAALRPPGHHATRRRAMGFCLLNNVAIAARHLVAEGLAKRPVIVDFDVHHGNGTQDIFYDDPSVIYVSIHQSHNYPGTGWPDETGAGDAEGTTINRPFPAQEPPENIVAGLAEVLSDVREQFAPDFVLVSAGFDGHRRDPLASWNLEAEHFATITRDIVALADAAAGGHVVSVLEGGYDLRAVGESVAAHVGELI